MVSDLSYPLCLDYFMDGQLGHDKENCSIPFLVEHFKGLGSPDSLTDRSSAASTESSLKVDYLDAFKF